MFTNRFCSTGYRDHQSGIFVQREISGQNKIIVLCVPFPYGVSQHVRVSYMDWINETVSSDFQVNGKLENLSTTIGKLFTLFLSSALVQAGACQRFKTN